MPGKDRTTNGGLNKATHGALNMDPKTNENEWPGIDSRYRLIVVAALRAKQLLHGSLPRIDADPLRRRNTSIALDETKRGLVPFTLTGKDGRDINGDETGNNDD
jgi:DNA-directed RNA polymerase omega subunit